ncbi:hypothetical protein GCM10028819_21530 [Spirosoma humi]
MVLVVPQNEPTCSRPVESGTFSQLGIKERTHIQEWVRHNTTVLGEDLKVISIEFDEFDQVADRPDILALDHEGNLVIIELKRDSLAAYADLQAIRYAALLSTITVADIVPMYVRYCQRYLQLPEITLEEGKRQLEEFINDSDFVKLSGKPRIILCAENFSPAITTTVLWLNSIGLDISCIRLQPYEVDGKLIIVPNKIIPTPEASQYMVRVQRKERQEEAAEEQQVKRRRQTLKILLENNILKAGDKIYLKAGMPYVAFLEDDDRFVATVIGNGTQNIKWEHDGNEYKISALTRQIFNSFNSNFTRTPNGNAHWTSEEGIVLWQLAENHLGAQIAE